MPAISPAAIRPATARQTLCALLMLGAVGEGVLDQGGYRPTQRIAFAAVALTAGAVALAQREPDARRAARSRPVLCLWALGILGALSALWTIGLVGDSIRWGLVTLGYGTTATAAGWLASRRGGARVLACGITAIATASAAVGLYGAAIHSGPFSDYVRGSWRPGGTLEYSDAMALLALSGLPAALSGMCARRWWIRAPAATAAACLITVLFLDFTRLELGLLALLCLWVVWDPAGTVRASRRLALAACAGALAMGGAAHLLYGRPAAMAAAPHPARELLVLSLLAVCFTTAWLLASWRLAAGRSGTHAGAPRNRGWKTPSGRLVVLLITGCLLAGGGAALLTNGPAAPRYVSHAKDGGFWHGRLRLWRASVQVAVHRPLQGYGADAYLAATLARQGFDPIRFAHSLPLELAVELGIPGLLLVIALYVTSGVMLVRRRRDGAFWLLGPGAGGFLISSLVDWPWHLAGSGAVWAAALGALAARPGPIALPQQWAISRGATIS